MCVCVCVHLEQAVFPFDILALHVKSKSSAMYVSNNKMNATQYQHVIHV